MIRQVTCLAAAVCLAGSTANGLPTETTWNHLTGYCSICFADGNCATIQCSTAVCCLSASDHLNSQFACCTSQQHCEFEISIYGPHIPKCGVGSYIP